MIPKETKILCRYYMAPFPCRASMYTVRFTLLFVIRTSIHPDCTKPVRYNIFVTDDILNCFYTDFVHMFMTEYPTNYIWNWTWDLIVQRATMILPNHWGGTIPSIQESLCLSPPVILTSMYNFRLQGLVASYVEALPKFRYKLPLPSSGYVLLKGEWTDWVIFSVLPCTQAEDGD